MTRNGINQFIYSRGSQAASNSVAHLSKNLNQQRPFTANNNTLLKGGTTPTNRTLSTRVGSSKYGATTTFNRRPRASVNFTKVIKIMSSDMNEETNFGINPSQRIRPETANDTRPKGF